MDKIYEKKGYELWTDYFNSEKVDIIKEKLDRFFDLNENLGPAVNVSILKNHELNTYGAQREEVQKKNKNFFISKDVLDKGVNFYRNLTNGRSLIDPLLRIKEIADLITDDNILNFVKKNLKEDKIHIGYIKLRRFFNNDINNFDTNFFHTDDNCDKILKCIVYLDDILKVEDGPFVYVEGSHEKKFKTVNNLNEYSRTDKEIENFYSTDNIKPLYGRKGTLLFANTLGYHKGIKPKSKDRYALYINYVCEQEYGGKGEKQKISRELLEKYSDKSNLFDFFQVV